MIYHKNAEVIIQRISAIVTALIRTFKAAKKCNFEQITLMAKMKGFFKLFGLGKKF